MNTPNPLIPQGSLEAQQYQKRSATKLVVSSILAVHGIVLGGLLFLGCSKEEPEVKTVDNRTFDSLDAPFTGSRNPEGSSPFGDLGISTNSPIEIPLPETLPPDTNIGGTFPPLPPGATGGVDVAIPPAANPPIPVQTEPAAPTKYAVLPGDNFTTIARKHGVSLKDITAANADVDSRKLKVGQVINLPAHVTPIAPAIPAGTPDAGTSGDVTHTVGSGDTLSKLSRDYKVSVKDIQRANNLRGSVIRVGQKLIIPGAANTPSGQ
jgi:LysM repeat protein